MPTDLRNQLINVMAAAIRESTDGTSPEETAHKAARATGMRRSFWATQTEEKQLRLIKAAVRRAKEEPYE